jgi:hypothetical protein
MQTVQAIEQAIQQLPEAELCELRRWFTEFTEELWDKQIENDAKAGKLDALAAEALAEYHRDLSTITI